MLSVVFSALVALASPQSLGDAPLHPMEIARASRFIRVDESMRLALDWDAGPSEFDRASTMAAPLTGPGAGQLRPAAQPMLWPAHGEITTYFGEVGWTSPRGHAGLDIAGPWGAPVVAVEEGQVVQARVDGGYGLKVVIEHAGGRQTLYAHLSAFAVEPGEQVSRGQQIGRIGSTGFSTGAHLHFEVYQDGDRQDPLKYLLSPA